MISRVVALVIFTNVVITPSVYSFNFTRDCDNGEAISSESFCDGRKDCTDGSDETVLTCLHVRCPSFAFKCTYGACVNGDAECNGKQDCVDNSDETTIRCQGILESFGIRGNCSQGQFQCDSGECIQEDDACDGKKNCKDASDETVELCSAFYCPVFAFRCGYGACVNGNARCDGIVDCIDASDESLSSCGKNHSVIQTTPTSMDDNTRTESTLIPSTTQRTTSKVGCLVERIPHLKYFHITDDYVLRPGYRVDSMSIKYKCGRKYLLEGSTTNFCSNGEWANPHPKCLKYCSYIPILGITFTTTCEYNGIAIACNQPIAPGTKARFTCAKGYTSPNRTVHEEVVCDTQGEWDYSPSRCEQICGIEPEHSQEISILPWNVGIYSKRRGSGYDQICGGTIINAKIVLSAAHCFWNAKKGKAKAKGKFAVAVGKYYRNYEASEPNLIQYLNISELVIPPEYTGSELFYQNDLAILVLNNFISFTPFVRPICLEWLTVKEQDSQLTSSGRIGGWGSFNNDDDENSSELRILDLNVVDYKDCLDRTAFEYRNLITNDKFCIDSYKGATICETDSGAGFAVSRSVNGVKTYFLSGIISNTLTSKNQCGGDFCTACTNIQFHANIIIEYETKYRPK